MAFGGDYLEDGAVIWVEGGAPVGPCGMEEEGVMGYWGAVDYLARWRRPSSRKERRWQGGGGAASKQ